MCRSATAPVRLQIEQLHDVTSAGAVSTSMRIAPQWQVSSGMWSVPASACVDAFDQCKEGLITGSGENSTDH
jgi:hypothetical protein